MATPTATTTAATTISLRVSMEYRAFLRELAERERMSVAALIDRAVTAYSEAAGSPSSPPKR